MPRAATARACPEVSKGSPHVSTTATASARIDVQPDAAWAWFSLVLGSASGLTLAAWVFAGQSWPMAAAAMAMLAIIGAAVGLVALRHPVGTLCRREEAWWWHRVGQEVDPSSEGCGAQGDVAVTIDLGRWMLVRFEPIESPDEVSGRLRSQRRRRPAMWLPVSAGVPGDAAWSAWRTLLLSRRATMLEHLRRPDPRGSGPDR